MSKKTDLSQPTSVYGPEETKRVDSKKDISTVRKEVIERLTLDEDGFRIKRTEEELSKLDLNQSSIYDYEVSSNGTLSMEIEELAKLLEKNREKEIDPANQDIQVDRMSIGDNTLDVAAVKVLNTAMNKLTKCHMKSVAIGFFLSRVKASGLELADTVQKMPKFRKRRKTDIQNDLVTMNANEAAYRISCLLDFNDLAYPDRLDELLEASINFKGNIVTETLSKLSDELTDRDKIDVLRSLIFITNNRRIRERIKERLSARGLNDQDIFLKDKINDVMLILNQDLEIKQLGDLKITLGIDVTDISRDPEFKWSAWSRNKGYKKIGETYQRAIYENDTMSTMPVFSEDVERYLHDYYELVERFVFWINKEVEFIISGEVKELPDFGSFKSELYNPATNKKQYEVLGLSLDTANKLISEIEEKINVVVDDCIERSIISLLSHDQELALEE